MTQAEHAKVWREVLQTLEIQWAPIELRLLAQTVAQAYEQAAKEQEGRD